MPKGKKILLHAKEFSYFIFATCFPLMPYTHTSPSAPVIWIDILTLASIFGMMPEGPCTCRLFPEKSSTGCRGSPLRPTGQPLP